MTRALALFASFTILVTACGGATAPTPSPTVAKTALEIAYADDPSREALLWAITHGKVTSSSIDVTVRFLPLAQIIPAANTKQFDAIEATPLAVARTAGGEPGFLILSSGLRNGLGTLLVTGKTSPIAKPVDLKGKTIAVASLGGTFVLEARYVLQKRYGLNADLKTGDVKFSETPQEAVPQLLKEGRLDAAVTTQLLTYRLKDSPDHRVLSELTREFAELAGGKSINSIVVTYKERAATRGKALADLQRMLGDSLAYLRANREAVLAEVAAARKLEPAYLAWFFQAYELRAGPVSEADKGEIRASWEAAKLVGDATTVPNLEDVLFKP